MWSCETKHNSSNFRN